MSLQFRPARRAPVFEPLAAPTVLPPAVSQETPEGVTGEPSAGTGRFPLISGEILLAAAHPEQMVRELKAILPLLSPQSGLFAYRVGHEDRGAGRLEALVLMAFQRGSSELRAAAAPVLAALDAMNSLADSAPAQWDLLRNLARSFDTREREALAIALGEYAETPADYNEDPNVSLRDVMRGLRHLCRDSEPSVQVAAHLSLMRFTERAVRCVLPAREGRLFSDSIISAAALATSLSLRDPDSSRALILGIIGGDRGVVRELLRYAGSYPGSLAGKAPAESTPGSESHWYSRLPSQRPLILSTRYAVEILRLLTEHVQTLASLKPEVNQAAQRIKDLIGLRVEHLPIGESKLDYEPVAQLHAALPLAQLSERLEELSRGSDSDSSAL